MKKVLCLIFSIVLLVSAPFSVSAVVPSDNQIQPNVRLSREDVQALAVEAFPEYVDSITATPNASVCRSLALKSEDPVVFSETRDLNPNLSVNYTEFASGVNAATVLYKDYEIVSSSSNGSLTRQTIDFTVTTNVSSHTAYWDDFQCIFAFNDYDNITSVGYNPYPSSASYSMLVSQRKLAENSSGSAYVTYTGYLYLMYNNEQTVESVKFSLRANVGNDSFSLSVNRVA